MTTDDPNLTKNPDQRSRSNSGQRFTGLIRQFRSYYDKLGMMNQIASELPGLYGWFARKVVGSVVAQANKGLDMSSA